VNGGRPRTAREYVAATRALPAGSVLAAGDLAPTALSGAPQLLARLIPASREAALVGRRLAAPVEAGLPVPWASLAGVGGAPAAFTLAVGALHALGGALEPGDLVTVLATFTSPNGTVTVRVVGRGLVVLSVGQPPPGLDLASATIPVTVALGDPAVASELALANSVGRIDLMRDGDAAASTPSARAGTGTL
jgi:Flp pilus assembly protein CpaB